MANRNEYGGSFWDKLHLSDDELRRNDAVRAAAERGEISWDDAHAYAEGVRAPYGYSGGTDGSAYVKLSAAPAMPDSYGAAYRETLRRYTEAAPFAYDHASDPAYQAYKKTYVREGRRAGEETLGRYAAMTGGMPSTAAVTAAGQAQDYYNAKLADKIPELYELAYAMYTGEQDRLYRQLSALRTARGDERARYESALEQWNAERSRADARADKARQEELALAKLGAQYGDYSGLTALGLTPDVQPKGARAAGGRGASEPAQDAAAGEEALPVDLNSVLELGYGPVSAEKLSELVDSGKVEKYRDGGKWRFRRAGAPAAGPLPAAFADRLTARFG